MNSLELPILAFHLTSMDGFIKLDITEVFGYPNETSYAGGYAAKGILAIKSAGFTAENEHYFTTGELYRFGKALLLCYDKLSGTAVLESTELELALSCEFNKLGHVYIRGKFQPRMDLDNILQFELKTDQTQVIKTLSQLKAVKAVFGDEHGIHK